MKNIGYIFALLSTISSGPLHAAQDMGLALHDTGLGQRGTAVGTTFTMKVKLGPDRVIRKSERVKLGLTAGPIITIPQASTKNGMRREVSLVGFEWKPGYSASVNITGTPLATDYTRRGAAENDTDKSDQDKQNTGDKIGWIALVAGGVMVAVVGTYLLSCGPGESSNCGSD